MDREEEEAQFLLRNTNHGLWSDEHLSCFTLENVAEEEEEGVPPKSSSVTFSLPATSSSLSPSPPPNNINSRVVKHIS